MYSPALTDFVVMVDGTSHMFITGPDVIKTVTGEDVDMEDLGGGRAHNAQAPAWRTTSADDEEDAFSYVKELLIVPAVQQPLRTAVFPRRAAGADRGRRHRTDLELDDHPGLGEHALRHPRGDRRGCSTSGEFLEVHALFAPNIVVGFGRVDGRSVGVVANQPTQFAGCLDIDASEKAARFVRTCDAFNVPVLTFVDVPGFLPGTEQEWNGIIRRGAKLIYAYAEATVPKVTVITRKAYGGAYDVMGSKHLGADVNVAWPTAQIAVTGAAGAVNILYRKELAGLEGDELAARRLELQQEYEDTLANPYIAADRGYIDGVIPPPTPAATSPARCGCWPPSARRAPPASTGTSRCERRRRDTGGAAGVFRVIRGAPTTRRWPRWPSCWPRSRPGPPPPPPAGGRPLVRPGRPAARPAAPRSRRLARLRLAPLSTGRPRDAAAALRASATSRVVRP